MSDFLVPFGKAESEFTEKRSRFISHLWPVTTEEEAQSRIREMKARYHDARHNCWCYQLKNGGVQRYSDDGEPQGTAGQPMLNVFAREEVFDVCCVVTRYFGGILLGAGGLTRAYARGAKDALNAAGTARMLLWQSVRIPCTYPLLERVKGEVAAAGGEITDIQYGAAIDICARLPFENLPAFAARLTELSAGSLTVERLEQRFCPGPRLAAK